MIVTNCSAISSAAAFKDPMQCAVDIDRASRLFAGPGQADADIGCPGLSRAVDHTPHDRERQLLDTGMPSLPDGHIRARYGRRHVRRDPETDCARGPAATGTGGDRRCEGPQPESLQELTGCGDLVASLLPRARCERNPDGVADALLEQNRHCGCRPHDSSRSESGFGEAEVNRLPGVTCQLTVDRDQAGRVGRLARYDDAVFPETGFECFSGPLEGR